jgi:hypothetical protein
MTAQLQAIRLDEANPGTADSNWKGLYKVGGAAALVALLANLLVSSSVSGRQTSSSTAPRPRSNGSRYIRKIGSRAYTCSVS